jgi:restriction endonuclease S subunit
MVLRAKPDVALPEFLPFFMQSDLFTNRALAISVGSLSPTINWKTLAAQEFALPPLAEQRRIAEVLNAAESAVEMHQILLSRMSRLRDSLVEDFVGVPVTSESVNLGDIAEVQYGLTVNETRRNTGRKLPYLRVANVSRGFIDLSGLKEIGAVEGDDTFDLNHGDVLVVEGHANASEIGRAAMWESQIEKCLHQNHLIRVRCGPRLNPEFLTLYLNSTFARGYFLRHAKSTSGLNTINSSVVRNVPVPLLRLDQQSRITETTNDIRRGIADVQNRSLRLFELKQSLLACIGDTE